MAIDRSGSSVTRCLVAAVVCVMHAGALAADGARGEIVVAATLDGVTSTYLAELGPEPEPEQPAVPAAVPATATLVQEGAVSDPERVAAAADEPEPVAVPEAGRELVGAPADESAVTATAPQVEVPSVSSAAEVTPEPAPPAPAWRAINGSTLKGTVSTWARTAGWVVSWDEASPDLEVVGTVEARGSFIDAITYLFDVYHRSGATYDVTLFSEQKLLLVRNSK